MDLEKFKELGLSETALKELQRRGFEEPTEIQAKTIPLLLGDSVDVIGQARTGTGKTAAFGLPILDMLKSGAGHVQALVLVPTRELAIQVSEEIGSFRGNRKLTITSIYGGQSMPDQLHRLKKGVDIVVGTPGRVFDHIRRRSLVLDRVSWVVLDEADEMLNMGFIDEVEDILEYTNPERRTLLFSATMPDRIRTIAKKYMKDCKVVSMKKGQLTGDQTDQIYFEVASSDRFETLCRIVDVEHEFYGLVFCRTKAAVDELTVKLIDRGYDADGIHGDLSQNHRERILDSFRKRKITILAATDVAARGIDVTDLTHVINYSLPQGPESYIHRIGRTGRAGKKGIAVTFISPEEYRKLMHISGVTGKAIRKEKVPGAAQIVRIKQERLESELAGIIQEGLHRDHLKAATQILKNYEPVDIVAALLKSAWDDEFDEKKYGKIREFNEVSVDRKGTARLFISLGKKDGITPRKLIKVIIGESRVRAESIKDIQVMDSFSFVTVGFHDAETILKAFKGRGNKGAVVKRATEERKKTGKKR